MTSVREHRRFKNLAEAMFCAATRLRYEENSTPTIRLKGSAIADSRTFPLPQPMSTKVNPSTGNEMRRSERRNVDHGQGSYAMPLSRLALAISRFFSTTPPPVSTRCSQSKIIPEPRLIHHANRALRTLFMLLADIWRTPAVGVKIALRRFDNHGRHGNS